jgi:hypothetical protein
LHKVPISKLEREGNAMSKKLTKDEIFKMERAISELNAKLPEGAEVSGIVKQVASSGMSRRIAFLAVVNGRIENISFEIGKALGIRWNDDGSLTVRGCGMNMVFAVVNELEQVLGKKLNYNTP